MSWRKLLLASVTVIIAGSLFFIFKPQPAHPNLPTISATIGRMDYRLYAPKTTAEQQRGLAAFDSISELEGMIFRGNPVGVQGVWMKDMKFNIDIIWVDKDNRVVHLIENASKDSYPTIFQNPDSVSSAYIIELSSGQIKSSQIRKGDEVRINP